MGQLGDDGKEQRAHTLSVRTPGVRKGRISESEFLGS